MPKIQTGIVASVAERVWETEKTMAFVSALGLYTFEIIEMVKSSIIGQINKSPNVERSDKSSDKFPNPKGLKNKRIIVAVPKELSESGFLKNNFPITRIT